MTEPTTESKPAKPGRVAPLNLGSAFGTAPATDRVEQLPPVPPPPPRRAAPPPAPEPPTAPAEPVARKAPAPRRERREPPAPRAKTKPRGRRQAIDPDATGAYLPITLYEQLKRYWRDREETNVSYTDIILDAIEAQDRAGRLDALVAESLPGGGRAGHIFAGRVAQRRTRDEYSKPVTLRPGPGDLGLIDELADKHGAINRSHFIEVTLAAYLASKMGRRHDLTD